MEESLYINLLDLSIRGLEGFEELGSLAHIGTYEIFTHNKLPGLFPLELFSLSKKNKRGELKAVLNFFALIPDQEMPEKTFSKFPYLNTGINNILNVWCVDFLIQGLEIVKNLEKNGWEKMKDE